MLPNAVKISADTNHCYVGELLRFADTYGRQNETWCLDATEHAIIFRFAKEVDALVLRHRIRAQAITKLIS